MLAVVGREFINWVASAAPGQSGAPPQADGAGRRDEGGV